MPKRPTIVPLFASNAGADQVIEPVESVRNDGFSTDDRPPAQWFNWLFYHLGTWVDFLRGPSTSSWQRFETGSPGIFRAAADSATAESSSSMRSVRRIVAIPGSPSDGGPIYVSERGQLWTELTPQQSGGTLGYISGVFWTGGSWLISSTKSGSGRIWRTTPDQGVSSAIEDDANNWSSVLGAGVTTGVGCFALGESTIVAGCATKILYSVDDGASWAAASLGTATVSVFVEIVYTGQVWIGITLAGEVYKATDPTATWTKITTVTSTLGTSWGLATDGETVVAYPTGSPASESWIISTDQGATWSTFAAPDVRSVSQLQFYDSAWYLAALRVPFFLSANILDAASFVPSRLPVHTFIAGSPSSNPGVNFAVLSEGAWHLFLHDGSVLVGDRAADLTPGPWVPDDTPAQLHDAAYLRGQYVSNSAPSDGDVLTWDAGSTSWVPTAGGGGGGASVSDWKSSCRVATTANITLSGLQTVDGVLLSAGDRVLVRAQTAASENGIYGVAVGAWTRTSDADTDAEVGTGLSVYVDQGSTYARSIWALTTTGTITLGSTALAFTLMGGDGPQTIYGAKVFAHDVQCERYGVGVSAASLGVSVGVALSNAALGVLFRNSGDTAFLRALGWSGNHVLVGDNSVSGIQFRSGSAAPQVFYVNNVEMMRVDNLAVTIPVNIPLSIKDGGGSAREVLKTSGSTLALGSAYLTTTFTSESSLTFVIENGGPYTPLKLYDTNAILANSTPLSGENGAGDDKPIAVIDAGDVVVFGNADCDTRITAASELVLGLDGAAPTTPAVRGGNATGTDLPGGQLTIAPGLGTGSGAAPAVEIAVGIPGASGASQHTQQTGLAIIEPGNDEIAILVRLKRGAVAGYERVLVGAVDTAGVGYRALCVPN